MVFVPQFSSNLPKFMEILKFCALWDHVINFTHYAAICPGVFAKLNSNRNNRNNTLLSNHSLLSVTGVFAKVVNNRNNTLRKIGTTNGEYYHNLHHYLDDILRSKSYKIHF